MQLIKIEDMGSAALEIMEKPGEAAPLAIYVKAFQGKVIKSASDAELEAAISEAVTVVNFELGWKAKEEVEYDLTISTLRDDVRIFYPYLTLAEIKLACQLGARGHYGKFIALSVVTVNSWLSAYRMDKDRNTAKRALLEASAPKLPEAPKTLTREERVAFALTAYEEYKVKGSFPDHGNVVYNFLEAQGLILFDIERKKRILEGVKLQEVAKLKAKGSSAKNALERRSIGFEIEKVVAGKIDLKGLAKRAALNEYFNDLAELELELSDELKNNTNN